MISLLAKFLAAACLFAFISTAGASMCGDDFERELKVVSKEGHDARFEVMYGPGGASAASEAMKSRLELAEDRIVSFFQETLRRCGWPGRSKVGQEASMGFAMMVVNSDGNIPMQRYARWLMEKEITMKGEVPRELFAILTDKLLLSEKKPQRYGTQLDWRFKARPVEDMDGVDKLRAEMGMMPLAEYEETVRDLYETAKAKMQASTAK
jgi:hypothetical protein